MFHSQCFLSRKGPLGTIWVAAHCLNRLNKLQVAQTNISSSVDKILLDEVHVVSYRVLAYLLLGVVRIYSKKVEYLFHDCRQVLVKINDFAGIKTTNMRIEAICAPYLSITRPQRFELDAFDLQILEDGSGVNIRPDEDTVLADAWRNEGSGHYSFDKYHFEEDAEHFETCCTANTPVINVFSPYVMENDEVASLSHNLNNSEASIEKLQGNNFSLEERLDPLSFGEVEEGAGLDRPFGEKYDVDIDSIKVLETKNVLGDEEEPPDPMTLCDEEQHMNAEQIRVPKMISPESGQCQISMKDRLVSMNIDATPSYKNPNASGATTPDFMDVKTPATREPARVSRKRKCLFDDIIVLPNKVLKESIDDASNLVCKRGKVPHTPVDAWKAHHITDLPRSWLEPLIPCISLDLRALFCWKKLKRPEPIETVEAPEKLYKIGSPPFHRFREETDIAPSTPVTHPTSLRLHEVEDMANLDIERVNEDLNSCEGDYQEMNEWSVRTRTLASYIYRCFLNWKKRKEDEVLNLLQVLNRKTKRESARVFYEILVLKSGGYIDVKQGKPYADILVLETPKLMQIFEANNAKW